MIESSSPIEMRAPPPRRSALKRYGFAFAATALAFLVRLALDPWLSPKHPLSTTVIAITLVIWYSGFIPALIPYVLGYLLASWCFIPPIHSFKINDPAIALNYMFIGLSIILFGRAMHKARALADANAQQAIANQKRLELEVVERKRVENEIRLLNLELEKRVEMRTAELRESNHDLESFTYSVSHDLRAPLRHVDGYAQVLQEEFGSQMPATAQQFMRKIRLGSQNMGRLVDDLLKLSHLGKKDLIRQRTPLGPMVQGVVTDLAPEAASRLVDWRVGELSIVDCDPGLVRQVFVNLISNALKYSRPREKAVIEVGQKQLEGTLVFFVRDNGVGFNMKYAAKLFGVFQRLHRPEDFEGTGVGLATVARIIRKHGGKIWAEAAVNEGATFFFTLGTAAGSGVAEANLLVAA